MDLSGGVGDYPLCSIELYADMDAAVDTPTCFRRGERVSRSLMGNGRQRRIIIGKDRHDQKCLIS